MSKRIITECTRELVDLLPVQQYLGRGFEGIYGQVENSLYNQAKLIEGSKYVIY